MDYGKLKKRAVVLDFDGTICRLFVHYDLSTVNAELQNKLVKYGIDFKGYEDCFDVFKVINCQQLDFEQREQALNVANEIIQNAECEAVDTSVDIPGLNEFLDYCRSNGVGLGIATNNSANCIYRYLEKKGLSNHIPVYGRDVFNIEHLKPHPWSLNRVIEELDISKEQVLFVGDNPTDFECSLSANVDFIAIASTEKKKKRFERLKTECLVIEDYYELLQLSIVG